MWNLLDVMMKTNARIVVEDKWLVYNNTSKEWEVYQRKFNTKKTKVLISTPLQEDAIKILLEDDSIGDRLIDEYN